MLPSAISSGKKVLPMPKLSSTTLPTTGSIILHNKQNVLPSAIDALRGKSTSNTIEHVKSDIADIKDTKKSGRPTKAEKVKEAKMKMAESVSALVAKNPGKKDIRAYIEARIKELS